ncbi:hypothetical protein L873DRAFT_1837266 [Choiromyces venosus 120613-1]|uniref:DNA repair protein RAD5 n=1 Tax=Choiromyces venosus 120613-1 TaxID=1336337 RepID=A0A3N4JMZ2_9PEZI|nr:hypothetical protein L873DRAFT_1837266 [Choiromyces venosus 120613-1]
MESSITPSAKKRSLNSPPSELSSPEASSQLPTEKNMESSPNTESDGEFDSKFNREVKTFVGEKLSTETLRQLEDVSGGNIERAINMYFDRSWKTAVSKKRKVFHQSSVLVAGPSVVGPSIAGSNITKLPENDIPSKMFIGQLGVAGWATKSGSKLISYGDNVRIERSKMRFGETILPSAGAKSKGKASAGESSQQGASSAGKSTLLKSRKTQDIIVRFTNSKGDEIGRLPQDDASFVSTLIDQRIAYFEGICIYAPEKIHTNDTINLQLCCYLLKESFVNSSFRPADTNRGAGFFVAQENQDEKVLRLRQVALVKLFQRMSLEPKFTNAVTQKHKAAGILQAAEIAERHEIKNLNKPKNPLKATTVGAIDEFDEGDGSNEPEKEELLEEDQLSALYEKAQSFNSDTPEAEPANTFKLDLRRYQKQALHWFLSKEKSTDNRMNESMHPLWEEYAWPNEEEAHARAIRDLGQDSFYLNPYSGELSLKFPKQEHNCLGGILADEMGLGKTIEMLSLIHTHYPDPPGPSLRPTNSFDILQRQSDEVIPALFLTLVVAPTSLLAQWEEEARDASESGTLKTLVYYGQCKRELQAFYKASIVENRPSLVITSYGTVLGDFLQLVDSGRKRGTSGGLFSMNFFRIILDEAHHIKNRLNKTAKACYELSADHRWALTGTPIVNRLEDLFSLVRFLRVEPWSNFSFWKTFITVPFEEKDFLRALDVVQTVLEPLVLRRTKDMKTPDGEPLVPLPKKTTNIVHVKLSKAELDVYKHIEARARSDLDRSIEMGTVLKSYTNIFAHVLRLRQACCHPILIRKQEIVNDEIMAEAEHDAAKGFSDDMDLNALIDRYSVQETEASPNIYGANALKEIRDNVDNECPICLSDPMVEQTVTGCLHAACKGCWMQLIEAAKAKEELPKCATCRETINERDLFEVIRNELAPVEEGQPGSSKEQAGINLRRINARSSAKIELLIEKLVETQGTDPGRKSCVFSQFTTFLDLIEKELQRRRIKSHRFDGSMSQAKRAEVVQAFKADKSIHVFLLSLRAGGVGLNLTSASQVFMMDPWWSFAVEAQAIDRVHRMGQVSDVTVHRFIVEGSVEERIVHTVQERKKFIATSLGMMNDDEKKKARMEDIRILLGR